MQKRWILILTLLIVLVAACGQPEASPSGMEEPETETQAVVPTSTTVELQEPSPILPSPTAAPEASPTPVPTVVPEPIMEANLHRLAPQWVFEGHTDNVTQAVFSNDGAWVASSSVDQTARIWSVSSGEMQYVLEGHTGAVNSVDISPDGQQVVTGSDDRKAKMWQLSDGNLIRTIESGLVGRILEVEYTPDGSLIALGGHICYLELRWNSSGILFRTLAQPNCVAKHYGSVASWGMAFSPDGRYIFTGEGRGCCTGSIQRWVVEEYEAPDLIKGYQVKITDLAYSPDGSQLAVALLGSTNFWMLNAEDGSLMHIFEGKTYRVNCVAFSPDGSLLASGARDGTIRIWRVSDYESVYVLEGHTDAINSLEFSADGSMLVSASNDDTAIVWGLGDS